MHVGPTLRTGAEKADGCWPDTGDRGVGGAGLEVLEYSELLPRIVSTFGNWDGPFKRKLKPSRSSEPRSNPWARL